MITTESFGSTAQGEAVEAFILTNAAGIRVKIINYGATIVSLETPDRDGKLADIVLGFDDMEGYQSDSNPYFGTCCGRFANRIKEAKFSIDGTEYTLAANDGVNSLHGGDVGFDKKIWATEILDEQSIKMTLISPDGEEGYPGTLKTELIYTLSDDGSLALRYKAETDKKTIVNLTNHSYFNLAGTGSIHGHTIEINADQFAVVDDTAIPTGALKDVAGTEMDLRTPTLIGTNIASVQGGGYDHNYCINQKAAGELTFAAKVVEPASGRTLECLTTEPGIQFYAGNFLNNISGKGGAIYNKQEGLCLETQHYPDAPNRPEFASVELAPGETYSHTCIYTFGVEA